MIKALKKGGLLQFLKSVFWKKEGGKKRLRLKICLILSSLLLLVIGLFWLWFSIEEQNSIAKKIEVFQTLRHPTHFKGHIGNGEMPLASSSSPEQAQQQTSEKKNASQKTRTTTESNVSQIITAVENRASFNGLPIGSRLIGRLLTGLDSRSLGQLVKVELSYGGGFGGKQILPALSILIGKASLSGGRFLLRFGAGVYPSGHEFRISALALDPTDFSEGLNGSEQSRMGLRGLSTLALKAVGVGADVLTKKESLSETSSPTPKSSLENAGYAGLAAVAEDEAAHQNRRLDSEDFITLEVGSGLIIELTESFKTSN